MYISLASENELWHVDKRMSEDRAAVLAHYLKSYFEPALEIFPEMSGQVHLSLQSDGFFFRTAPRYEIVVSSKLVKTRPAVSLRYSAAYILAYFTLYHWGCDLTAKTVYTEKYKDRRAVFLAFARGYAKDYLTLLTGKCQKSYCDMKTMQDGFRCGDFFAVPCRASNAPKLERLALSLERAAAKCRFEDESDFDAILQDILKSSVR